MPNGVDTVAVVVPNDHEVLQALDMHRTHRVDVTSILRPGANDLEVRFSAPGSMAVADRSRPGSRPDAPAPTGC